MFSIHFAALSNPLAVRALENRSHFANVPLLILAHIYPVPMPKQMKNLRLKLSGDKNLSELIHNLFND